MEYLISRVEECISEGYDTLFCLIDKDNKSGVTEQKEYNSFVKKYSGKKIKNSQTGGTTEIIIIENNPCLEIWFYYYFRLSTGLFSSYEKINPLKASSFRNMRSELIFQEMWWFTSIPYIQRR